MSSEFKAFSFRDRFVDEKFYGELPMEIETTEITRDPASLGLSEHWRVWRFYEYHPWWKRLLNLCHYKIWYACYTVRHLHFPMVIKEYPCGFLLVPASKD